MFTPTKLVFLLSVTLSVLALPSHMGRSLHLHREIAARVAQPIAQPEFAPVPQVAARDMSVPSKRMARRRRSTSGRCNTNAPSPSGTQDPNNTPVNNNPVNTPPVNPTNTPNQDPTPTNTPEQDPTPTTSPDQYSNPTNTPVVDTKPSPTPNQDPTPTTPQEDPTPTPSPSPSPTPNNSGNGNSGNTGSGQTYTGQGTFYATGLGACGITNNDSQNIAAVSHLFFDSYPGYDGVNPNSNPLCGKTAVVNYQGKTVTVQLTDRCEACAYGDLDFSPNAFDQLSDPSVGRISGISWQIVN